MAAIRELVLVGAGHAHVQALAAFAMRPPRRTRLTLVVDTPIAVYSGMVPGFVAGQYRAHELEIDAVPLARRAGCRVILAPALAVDARCGRIEVEGRPPVPYDVASFDIGSTVAGLDLPGIREHALPTRPISLFVRRLEELVDRVRRRQGGAAARVVVVGGGAGGVEVAFCLEHRLRAEGLAAEITLVQNKARILPGVAAGLVRRVERAAAARSLEIRTEVEVAAAETDAVLLADGERLACDALAWTTGAASLSLFQRSGLPTDDRGFVEVRSTLQILGHDELFAVGDCAHLLAHPDTPKAGVYAVREGPYVTGNLRSFLEGAPLAAYRPQSDFLTLLNLGDGSAVGGKWGLSVDGRWVMRLKDWIDRRFMRRFQVLQTDGRLTERFSGEPEMGSGDEPMPCGGCAAKVGRTVLQRALGRLAAELGPDGSGEELVLGLDRRDDAAAWRPAAGARGELVVSSVDAFRAFTDDPYLVGRVAAVNALADVQVKGARPRIALALVTVPDDEDESAQEETLFQVLAGARAALGPLGVALAGGHSTTGPELAVGFAVDGTIESEARLLRLAGLRPGDALILTKPLGTGVVLRADMEGRARGPWLAAALESMQQPSAEAAAIAAAAEASAATDVTGFGLAGHLVEMLEAAGLTARLQLAALPVLPGAAELLSLGVRSTFHPANAAARTAVQASPAAAADPRLELLFDPQTSGGLLFGVGPDRAEATVRRLRAAAAPQAAVVGRAAPARGDAVLIEIG